MAAYIRGDAEAFDALYRYFAPRLYRFFLGRFRDAAIASDLFQTTFFKVHRRRDSYRTGSPVSPWLFTIAERVRIDELRRRGREAARRRELDLEEAPGAPPSPPGPDAAVVAAVRDAIADLPEGQREVVLLHKLEGLPLARVGEVLGITEGAAKVRAHRAYGTLRKLLAPRLAELDLDVALGPPGAGKGDE